MHVTFQIQIAILMELGKTTLLVYGQPRAISSLKAD